MSRAFAITCSPATAARLGSLLPSVGCHPSWYGLVDPFFSFPKAGAGTSGICLTLGTICERVGEGEHHTTIRREEVLIRENHQQDEA